jgi:hypothetical protein
MNAMDLDFSATANPFASVVLCCTGVDHEERVNTIDAILISQSAIVNQAQQMGAIYKADLRSDVSHMIVGDTNTPKYQVQLSIWQD